jgi:hypothetical protein
MLNLFTRTTDAIKAILPQPLTEDQKAALEFRREWDRQLSLAISDRDRAEIDTIFARAEEDMSK